MPLFPQLGPQYYNEKHRDILSKMESSYAESITINQSFWAEADTDQRFYAGDQSLWNDLFGNLPANRRRQFNFNRIRRVINMVQGYQRRNRKSTIVVPIENGDAETADQFTKVLNWIQNREGVYETISHAFEGALVTGMNLLHVWMDYREDPLSGNIKVDSCPASTFLIDNYFKKPDLSDCQYVWKRTYVTKRDAISLLPDKVDEIMGLIQNNYGTKDGKFQFQAESYNYSYSNLLTYDEYYYRTYRTQKMLCDTETGETLEWRGQDESLKEFLSIYPQVTVIEQDVPTVNLAIVLQNKVMYAGPQPMGIDQYPFVPVMGYYHPELPYWPWRIQGIVRGLRDSQFLYNRRKVIELDILESQITSGWKYKENALVNPKDVFLQGQGRGLALKEEAQMTDAEQIMPPQVPPSMIQLSEILGREIQEISGVNEELLGSAIDEKAGILAMLRQGAGLTTLQILFDQLDFSQKLLGKIMIDLVQANFTPGKIQKILEGKQPSPQFYNKAFGRYHAAVEEGLNTTTQKQMQFAQLLQLRQAGVPVPDEILLESCTLQNKKQLIDSIQQTQQIQAQVQQAQTQVAMQEAQARTNLANARAQADQGLGLERLSRIQENQALAVERKAQAEKDRDIGLLNLVKTVKELETLDLENIEKFLSLARLVKNQTESVATQPQNIIG